MSVKVFRQPTVAGGEDGFVPVQGLRDVADLRPLQQIDKIRIRELSDAPLNPYHVVDELLSIKAELLQTFFEIVLHLILQRRPCFLDKMLYRFQQIYRSKELRQERALRRDA